MNHPTVFGFELEGFGGLPEALQQHLVIVNSARPIQLSDVHFVTRPAYGGYAGFAK